MEDYRAKQNKGETLNEEQLKAVAKLDDVLSQIELLQDLIKQFTTHSIEVSFKAYCSKPFKLYGLMFKSAFTNK